MRVYKITKEMFDSLRETDPSSPFYNSYRLRPTTVEAVRRCKDWNHWLAHKYKERTYMKRYYRERRKRGTTSTIQESESHPFGTLKTVPLLDLLLLQRDISVELERRGVKQ